jgi:carboxyl-terminal processing protease
LEVSPKELIDEVWQIVNRQYIDATFNGHDWKAVRQQYLNRSYESNEDAYQSIREMLNLLGDSYTRFIGPQEFKNMQVDTSQDSVGIGLQLAQDEKTKEVVTIAPIEDTPAFMAGILSQDVLVKIDDQSTQGMDLNEVVRQLRGPAGTEVVVRVRRGQQEREFRVRRSPVVIHPVRYASQEIAVGKIGYIRLTQFSVSATEEMRSAITDLEKQQVAGYILDLRSNPGGLLSASAEIARMWINNGTIFSTVERQGETDRQQANNSAITDKPLVVLVDGGSAAASEILSGALQDNQRAVVVGTTTFGSNTIQSVRSLLNSSGLAVTVAKWLTPKGRDIQKSGLSPDVVVEMTEAQQQALRSQRQLIGTPADPQYSKATEILTQVIQSSPRKNRS